MNLQFILQEAEDEVFEHRTITDGVFMVREKLYKSWNVANIFVVQGNAADLVIDTGIGLWDLPDYLRRHQLAGHSGKPVQVVLTHIHFDHSGGASRFPSVSIHEAEANALSEGDNCLACSFLFRGEIPVKPYPHFNPKKYGIDAVKPSRMLVDGDVFNLGDVTLEVLHTPGHTAGSICLFDRRRGLLFSGDTLYEGPIFDCLQSSNITSYMATARRLLELQDEVKLVCPGHCECFETARYCELLEEYLKRDGCCYRFGRGVVKGPIIGLSLAQNSSGVGSCICNVCCCCFCIRCCVQ